MPLSAIYRGFEQFFYSTDDGCCGGDRFSGLFRFAVARFCLLCLAVISRRRHLPNRLQSWTRDWPGSCLVFHLSCSGMLWVAVESHSNSQHASEEVVYSGVARSDNRPHCLVPRWPMNGLSLLHLLCCEAESSGRPLSSVPHRFPSLLSPTIIRHPREAP